MTGGRTLYEPVGGMVIRAPLLPVQRYLDLPGSTPAGRDDPLLARAVAVASEDLAAALARPGAPDGRRAEALLRYRIRSATRPTPFGLFGGVAVGGWGPITDLRIADALRPTRTRPDMGWLVDAVRTVERAAPGRLRLQANTCAFERAGRLHLTDRSAGGEAGPDVSVRATPVVRRVLALARTPIAYDALVAAVLGATPGAPRERVCGLVDELARQDLLVSDLRPPLTADPAAHVWSRLATLADVPAARDVAARLADAVDRAALLDAVLADPDAGSSARNGSSPDPVAVLTALRARLREADTDPGAAEPSGQAGRDVVQLNSALPLAGHAVTAAVAADAARAVDLLLRLHPSPGGPPHLAAYRAAFAARYGHDRSVPLLELLDPRFGLGPPDGHAFGHAVGPVDREARARRAERLTELAWAGLQDGRAPEGAPEVVLDDADLAALSTWTPDPQQLLPSLELSAFVLAPSAAALDRGEHRLLVGPNLGAHAAGRGLGRFADLLGDPATGLLDAITAAEEARRRPTNGATGIVAELVYLPRQRRAANVAIRPAVRRYEIPVGVAPGVPADLVIAADELRVHVREGRLRLWWERGGVEVAVSAGHMLNTNSAPQVCRFLHEVGLDGITALTGFDWGPAEGQPVLPRVRYGRIVLRPAQWRRRRARAAEELAVRDPAAFAAALPAWRRRLRLPRRVYLAEGDNRLLLDLDDPAQAGLLAADLRRSLGGDLVLHEALPGPDDAWLPGPGGHYVSELVVPMVRRAPAAGRPATAPAAAVTHDDGDRRRAPGSDWLYLTLTGPAAGHDALITGPVRALADGLVARGEARSWFFLRYNDPEPHLRLRLHGDPATLLARALPVAMATAAELVGAGTLHRAGLEVYDRELERYGGPEALAVAEELFAADSRAVAALLPLARSPGERLCLAGLGIDDLLDALGLDAAARLAWYSDAAPPPKETAGAHRQHGPRLRDLLDGPGDDSVSAALAERRAVVVPLGARLAALHAAGTCPVSLPTLARSFTHLHGNRWGVDPAAERTLLGLLRRALHARLRQPAAAHR
jgi:thiopeptide-type bacteriocin biosynthesis protein